MHGLGPGKLRACLWLAVVRRREIWHQVPKKSANLEDKGLWKASCSPCPEPACSVISSPHPSSPHWWPLCKLDAESNDQWGL